ncbi:MAG: cellulase family glycosylhydrolase [Bacteroidia bacterium]|nr:cellulase family glycosylhydrolase [Bacteroidia bacterium]
MNRLSIVASHFLLIAIFLSSCQKSESLTDQSTEDNSSFQIKRGTNIAHWLSQSARRGIEREEFFTEKDIQFIDSVGFDHIRLPIDEEQMWDENGQRYDDAFALLKNSLEWCKKAGLRVVVDLHILRSHHFNAAEKPLWTIPAEQDKFIFLWKDLSSFLKDWPNGMVAYEFMNEPVADDPEQWNILLSRVADSIRHWEPKRVLVIGSNRWQSANTFDQLKIPANDPNILLSFHFYEPFFLSHYQASWTRLKDFKGDVNYPGEIVLNSDDPEHKRVYNRDTLLNMMRKPLQLAASLKLPLYCGEFGIIDKSPTEPKLAWYRDMVSIFDEHGIGYANWNYKAGSFGIVDKDIKPDLPIIKILTNPKAK